MNDPEPASVGAFFDAIECHDVPALTGVLDSGFSASEPVRGKSPVQWLLEMYLRSPRFPACLRLLLDRGAALPEPLLRPLLLDDAPSLRAALHADPALLHRRFDLVSAFTSLRGASLLHIAAEYGLLEATNVLLEAGADVEARAAADGDDGDGGDGHTPLFHTVASIRDHGAPVMRCLLAAGARTDVRVTSLAWGRGFEWETTFYDVTPIGYCQAGLMPQVHRREADVYRNLGDLLAAAGRRPPSLVNVPNRYLQPRKAAGGA